MAIEAQIEEFLITMNGEKLVSCDTSPCLLLTNSTSIGRVYQKHGCYAMKAWYLGRKENVLQDVANWPGIRKQGNEETRLSGILTIRKPGYQEYRHAGHTLQSRHRKNSRIMFGTSIISHWPLDYC